MANRNNRVPPLSDDERARLLSEIRTHGEHRAAIRLGLARQTMARAIARLPMQSGSILMIRAAIAALSEKNSPPPQAA